MGKGTPAHDEPTIEAREPKFPRGISEDDWKNHMDADAGELIVEDTVEGIIAGVLNQLHDHVLNNSAKPFLARKAKDSLVCMIDAAFLAHDTGEPDIATDPRWNPGEEPVPCCRDSWARGSVPVRRRQTQTSVVAARALHFALKPSRIFTPDIDPTAVPAEAAPGATLPKNEDCSGQGVAEAEEPGDGDGASCPTSGGSEEIAPPGLSAGLPQPVSPTQTFEQGVRPTKHADETNTAADASGEAALDPAAAGEPAAKRAAGHNHPRFTASALRQASGTADLPPSKPSTKSAVADAMIKTRNTRERTAIAKIPSDRNGAPVRRGSFADGSKVAMKKVDGTKLPRNRVVPAVAISPAKASPPRRPTPPGRGRQTKSRHPISRASKATKTK